jgi:hypothetical protein
VEEERWAWDTSHETPSLALADAKGDRVQDTQGYYIGDAMKHYDIEFAPNQFPEGYTMRAEKIRQGLKAIAALGIITFVAAVLIWGLP